MKYLIVVDMQKDFIDGSLGRQKRRRLLRKSLLKWQVMMGKLYLPMIHTMIIIFLRRKGNFCR